MYLVRILREKKAGDFMKENEAIKIVKAGGNMNE